MPGYPYGCAACIDGACYNASTGVIMKFTGRNSHASMPEKGINPAFAISRLVLEISSILGNGEYEKRVDCTVIEIKVGEKAFGTSAGYGELSLTLRGELESDMYLLKDNIVGEAKKLCGEYGLTFSYDLIETFPKTANDKAAMDKVRKVCREIGIPVYEKTAPSRGSDDFGYYLKLVPGAYIHFGCGDMLPIHIGDFDFPDDIMGPVIEMLEGIAAAEPLNTGR